MREGGEMSGNWEKLCDAATGGLVAARFSREEIDIFRQWFNAVQDINPAYLETSDYQLAQKMHEMLGIRVADSITRHLP